MDVRETRGQESLVSQIYAERIANETANLTNSTNSTNTTEANDTLPDFVPENKENIVDDKGIIFEEEFEFATEVWAYQIAEFKKKLDPSKIKKTAPVELAVKEVSRNGEPTIKFNQPLIVPTAYFEAYSRDREPSVGRRRALSQLRFIDVRRDLFEIEYHFMSDIDVDKMPFEVYLEDWTEDEIKFQLLFDHPLSVSRGAELDFITFQALEPSLFVSSLSLEQLPVENLKFKKTVPRQLPDGFDQVNLERMARIMRALVVIAMVVTAVGIWYSPFFKPLFFSLWSFFFTL
mmetsp:Transcript_2702/g.4231  ORF Transcript_2702/g.4231 Transcript_2702/m.4231 type:complete len:290 (+) Transcript_2702:4940-5809(+)